MAGSAITVREAVSNAIDELGGVASREDLIATVQTLRPGTKANTLGLHLVSMAVNNPSRVHYTSRGKQDFPRRFRSGLEVLFRNGDMFERYDAQRHGVWEVDRGADGKLVNRLAQEGTATNVVEAAVGVDLGGTVFAAESHLRDYLAKNLGQIEPGLTLYHGPGGEIGVEYGTDVGVIDLLAVDLQGGFVVIELKVGKTSDAVVGQALRYRNWVSRQMADGGLVRAVIVAEVLADQIRYAVEGLQGFELLEYEIQFRVHPVQRLPHLSDQHPQEGGGGHLVRVV